MVQQKSLQVSVGIVFAGLVVTVLGPRGCQLFKPLADVLDQATFVIVHIDRRCDVHRRDKAKAVLHATRAHGGFDLRRNVHHFPLARRVEPEVLRVGLHALIITMDTRADKRLLRSTDLLSSGLMDAARYDAESLYYTALDRLAEGDADGAVDDFRAALAADPAFLDAQHGLIRALQDLGRYDEGIAAAKSLAEQAPEDVLACTALSILYQHKGLIPEAEEAATRAKLLGWKQQLRASAGRQSD